MMKRSKVYADMHIHTNCSDGTWSTTKLLSFIKEKEIGLFSITDHDNIENSLDMLTRLECYGGQYIPGVEVNCTHQNKTCHITSYNYDKNNNAFLKLLEHNRKIWQDYNDDVAQFVSERNSTVSYSKYKDYVHNPDRGGWRLINFLFDEGIIKSLPEYFSLVKEYSGFPVFYDPVSVIDILKTAQAITFLAHPSAYSHGKPMPESELAKWKDFGIGGIECYSSYCSLEESDFYVRFCKRNKLKISGGSDCHGDFLDRKLGHPRITDDMIQIY